MMIFDGFAIQDSTNLRCGRQLVVVIRPPTQMSHRRDCACKCDRIPLIRMFWDIWEKNTNYELSELLGVIYELLSVTGQSSLSAITISVDVNKKLFLTPTTCLTTAGAWDVVQRAPDAHMAYTWLTLEVHPAKVESARGWSRFSHELRFFGISRINTLPDMESTSE